MKQDPIKTKYSKKIVNSNYYGTINVSGSTDDTLSAGTIFVPYIMETTKPDASPSDVYTEFMKMYALEHRYCPKCGSDSYSTTLMGYPLVQGEEQNYKDLNNCGCTNCGDVHTTHERVKDKI